MEQNERSAGIILAGGCSKRFGSPKQILNLEGKYLLEYVLEAALGSSLHHLVLVLGYKHQTILQKLGAGLHYPRLQIVINDRYQEGQSTSLQAGLLNLPGFFRSVMFLLGDQPLLDSGTIDHLLERFRFAGKDICVPVCNHKAGNPTIFKYTMYRQLLAINGDIGAREIIRKNSERVLRVEIENPRCFIDIDSRQDLEKLQSMGADPD